MPLIEVQEAWAVHALEKISLNGYVIELPPKLQIILVSKIANLYPFEGLGEDAIVAELLEQSAKSATSH